jgi:hypothetical protein
VYYLYFPYVLLLSGLLFFECVQKKHPRWWAVAVLLAPITTPYFIFKLRKRQGMLLCVIFLGTFMGVSAFEFYTYARMKEENRYSHFPPITRQVITLATDLKQSTLDLDKALLTLEQISKVESRIKEVKNTLEFIETVRRVMAENEASIHRLVTFIAEYKVYFVKKDLNWVYQVQEFYTNRSVLSYHNSLQTYLDDFKALLTYVYTNFYHITEAKTKARLENYDEYYLRYRRAVDSYNLFNVQRIEFQNEFLLQYPEVRPYLPGERQTETFKLWE